jgi:hypothetical protein
VVDGVKMTEEEPNLEGNVSESYEGVSRELKEFCKPMNDEISKYCQSLAAYNQLRGKEKPEQAAATTTGLLMMANLLGKLRKGDNPFLYTMAETLFRDYAKEDAGWNDEKIEAYLKKVEESQKPK